MGVILVEQPEFVQRNIASQLILGCGNHGSGKPGLRGVSSQVTPMMCNHLLAMRVASVR